MRNRLPKALFGLASVMLYPFPVRAQVPDYRQCLPFPSYEEEIRDMLGVAPVTPVEKRPRQIAFVERVKLLGAKTLPPVLREQIIASLLHREFDADSDWLPEVQEIGIRGLLRQHGYFNTWVTGSFDPSATGGRTRVAVTVEVDEGLQYRLAQIRFASADPERPLTFPPQELRKLIPIDDGDIFNVVLLRQGFENLRGLYDANGYIDFVAEPDFMVDDAQQEITLTILLVSGKQFRIGTVEFPNLDAETVKRLKSIPAPGEIFNNETYVKFFEENKAIIPFAQPEHVEIRRNLRKGTVDMTFEVVSWYELWGRLFRCLQMRLLAMRPPACRSEF